MNTESFLSLPTFKKFSVFLSIVKVFNFISVCIWVFYCTFHACFLTVATAYCMSTSPASANVKALVGFCAPTVLALTYPKWRLGIAEQIMHLAHRVN